ncbi:MAG: hypothetical protein AB7O43_04785 [Hyphomicrobiaceae bacterium]
MVSLQQLAKRVMRTVAGGLAAMALAGALAVAEMPAVSAQDKSQDSQLQPDFKQIKLTEKHLTGFLGAQKDLIAITAKLEAAGDTIDAKLQKELDDIGVRNGFKDFADFEEARANIMLVMVGLDPDTEKYTDPAELIRQDIEAIKADKSLSEADRKSQLEEMNEALKEIQPLQYKENIEVVRKFAKQVDEALK